jgi:hypothetical protein
MYRDHNRGERVHVRGWSGGLIVWICIGLIVGFAAGFILTEVYPALATFSAPLTCNNGTILTQQSTSSQQAGSMTIHFKAFCSVAGNQQDITGQVLTRDAGILAVFTAILFALLFMLFVTK